jgi:hypothetical protein
MAPALRQLARLVSPDDLDLPLRDPMAILPALERLLANEDLSALSADDRRSLAAELMHYIAHLLRSEHGGGWELDREPASPTFGRYVLTKFTRNALPLAIVEPGAIAHDIVVSPPPRSLIAAIDAAEGRLRPYSGATQERARRTVFSAESVEAAWTALFENDLLPASWHDAALRRFVHVDAGFERIGEADRAHPASREACTFFACNAESLALVEDAARALASGPMSPGDRSMAPIRWKVIRERPHGAVALGSNDPASRDHADALDRASVYIESITPEGITLVAYGVPCACSDADYRLRPQHASRHLGMDDSNRFADVSVETCMECGATWLEYFWEDHHDNGTRYRGLVASGVAREATANTAAALIEKLPWYWLGGTYFDGQTHRSSGPIRSH